MFYSCLISESGLKAFPLPLHPSDHNARHREIYQSSPMTVPGVRVRTVERTTGPLLEENSDFSQEPRPGEVQVQGLQVTSREHWPQSTQRALCFSGEVPTPSRQHSEAGSRNFSRASPQSPVRDVNLTDTALI